MSGTESSDLVSITSNQLNQQFYHRVNQVRSRLTTLPVNQRVIRVQDRRGNRHCNHRTNPRHSRQKSPRISPLSSLPYNLQANQPASLTGIFQRHQRHNYHSSYLHSHRCSLLTNLWDILPAIHTTIEWDIQSTFKSADDKALKRTFNTTML